MNEEIQQVLEDMDSQLNLIRKHVLVIAQDVCSMRVELARYKTRVNSDIVNISAKLTQIANHVEHTEHMTGKMAVKVLKPLVRYPGIQK